MNKLFTKIAGVTLGFAMAIGVGVAVAGRQEVKTVRAETGNETLTTSALQGSNTLFSWASGKNSGNDPMINGGKLRLYPGSFVTVSTSSASVKTIDTLVMTADVNTGGKAKVAPSSFTPSVGSGDYSSSNTGSGKTITFTTSSDSCKTITVTAAGQAGNISIASIVVNYTLDSGSTPVKGTLAITPVAENKLEIGAKGTFAYTLTGGTHTSLSTAVWGSDDTDVLTVNADTGAYEAVGAGNTTITLIGDDGDFDDYEATYDIQVVEPAPKYTDDTTNKTITWDLSVESYDSMTTEAAQWSSPKVTVAVAKGSAGTDTNNYCPPAYTSTRMYKNSSISFTPSSEYKITSIVAQATSSGYASALSGSTWTNATATSDSTTRVVTITPTVQKDAVSAVIGGTTGLTSIVVHYENVSNSPLSSITLSGTYPTVFKQGDDFSHTGMIVTANYEDESSSDVTSSATWTGYDMATAGEQEVTVSYTENEITKTAKYNITVQESIVLAGENFAMQVGDVDVAPVIKIKDTSTVVEGCTLTTSNANVASIVNNKVHAVAKGTATITAAHADANNKAYTSATFTVTVVDVNTYIEDIYDMNDNDPIDVYGYYAGKHSDGIILMDGEYGIIVYKASSDTTWIVDETIIHVTGTRTSFNGLVEIKNGAAVTKVTGQEETIVKTKISVPTNYSLTGAETSSDSSLSNRRTFVSGELTNINGSYYTITTPSSTNLTVYLKAGNDNNVTYHDEDGNEQTAKLSVYLASMLNKNVTVKGFTSIFNTYFQVLAYDIVEADNSFTVELFAQMILDETDGVCKNDNTTDLAAITAKWNKLGGEEGWEKLSTAERAKFQDHDVTPNYDAEAAGSHTVLENALGRYNVICKRYFQNNNFANRYDVNGAPVTPTESNSMFGSNESNEVATIVVIIAIASISAFGFLLILKKRKHQ